MSLTLVQRDVLATAAQVVRDLRVPDAVIAVQFGASREEIAEVVDRFSSSGDAGPISVEMVDIRLLYLLLGSLPDCFSSDEAFHVRTGFFRENFIDLARGLLMAVSNLPPELQGES